jgi:surfactin synthase thioesterase subunit
VLVERSLSACPQGVTWTTDPRLHGASAVKLTEPEIRAVLKALDMPTLLMLAGNNSSGRRALAEYARSHIASLTVRVMDGGHHFHMESQVHEVARQVNQFLANMEKHGIA